MLIVIAIIKAVMAFLPLVALVIDDYDKRHRPQGPGGRFVKWKRWLYVVAVVVAALGFIEPIVEAVSAQRDAVAAQLAAQKEQRREAATAALIEQAREKASTAVTDANVLIAKASQSERVLRHVNDEAARIGISQARVSAQLDGANVRLRRLSSTEDQTEISVGESIAYAARILHPVELSSIDISYSWPLNGEFLNIANRLQAECLRLAPTSGSDFSCLQTPLSNGGTYMSSISGDGSLPNLTHIIDPKPDEPNVGTGYTLPGDNQVDNPSLWLVFQRKKPSRHMTFSDVVLGATDAQEYVMPPRAIGDRDSQNWFSIDYRANSLGVAVPYRDSQSVGSNAFSAGSESLVVSNQDLIGKYVCIVQFENPQAPRIESLVLRFSPHNDTWGFNQFTYFRIPDNVAHRGYYDVWYHQIIAKDMDWQYLITAKELGRLAKPTAR